MKILINTPQLSDKGGVGSYYLSLKKYWKENVKYHTSGSRRIFQKNYKIPGLFFLPFDLFRFFIILVFWAPEVIVLNPSFDKNSIVRELIFLNVARLFLSKKICIFFRGWNNKYEEKANKRSLRNHLNKANVIVVLSSEFKNKLLEWGIDKPIELSTTKVDDSLLQNFNINRKEFDNKKILFLAKIKKEKGIYVALEVMKYFNSLPHSVELNIAGTGPDLEEAIDYTKIHKIKNVNFLGHISGDKLSQTLIDNNILLFPSFHGEGMPNSVLEAMAFGLPIITRPVGGIKDFFENGKMGYLINSKEPMDFFKAIEKFILRPNLIKKMGIYNHNYAFDNFLASKVSLKLEKLLKSI